MKRQQRKRLIGPVETWGLVGTGLVAAGLYLIYPPLSLLWGGGVILGMVYLTLPQPRRED